VDTAPPAVEPVDIQRVTAWTNGQVIFDNEALSSVVARVNRYTSTQIVISDPKVGAMRISGVLNAGDVNGFVDIVTRYLPVRAATDNAGDIALVSEAKN
jgi:transmembrane sensor